MRVSSCLAVAASLWLSAAPAASAAETAAASVSVAATFSSRTSLTVSTDLLQFDVVAPGRPATATVDFSAGARTRPGAEVLLSVEPMRQIGGAGDVEPSLSFTGDGIGTMDGSLAGAGPAVAGRWSGSGLRQGRLVFALRAGAAGRYRVPVRFVLSAP